MMHLLGIKIKTTLVVLTLVSATTLWSACESKEESARLHGLKAPLEQSWLFYKAAHMVNGERVRSNHYGGTITEGQSYAMLKAVWLNDPHTFDKVWQWTQKHMARPHDHLLGWRWGTKDNGKTGLIYDENATDADQDIAYALLRAGEQWQKPAYIQDAQAIIGDLWRLNVHQIRGHYYLSPGTWDAFTQDYLTLNPSYMAPYVYRTFAQYDPQHAAGWRALADHIYPTLEACSNLTANRLPPNWCSVDWQTGQIGYSDKQGDDSRHFTYDAFRVFWRMATDARMGSHKAKAYLANHTALLDYWHQYHTLPEGFRVDGQPYNPKRSGFAISAMVAQAGALEPANAQTIYNKALHPYYHPEGYWFEGYNDFMQSVIWFHVYTLTLPNASPDHIAKPVAP